MILQKIRFALFLAMFSATMVGSIETSHAIIDPCYRENSSVLRADRNVIVAQNFLDRVYANVDSVNNSLAITTANLEARVAEMQAYANAAGATAGGNIGGCAIAGAFFGFGRIGGCIGRGVASGIAQKARANAALRGAQGRLQSFLVYAENRRRREQQRIVLAQDTLAKRESELALANNALTQCRAATTVVPTPAITTY